MTDLAKLERNLTKLTADGSEPGKVANVAERILAINSTHTAALQCKVVCCMHRERYGAAIAALERLEQANHKIAKTSPEFSFHKAYCHYRMLLYPEAKAVLMNSPFSTQHLPSTHLLAQVHYNLEEYKDAAAIYEKLWAEGAYRDEQEKMELLTNYTAALAACDPRKAVTVTREADRKTFDLVYNAATALIEAGDHEAAMKALCQAEELCAKEHQGSPIRKLGDLLGFSEEDRVAMLGRPHDRPLLPGRHFFNDVATVWTQMAFIHLTRHEEQRALDILHIILTHEPSSAVTVAMASINWAAIKRHGDFFDSHGRLMATQHAKVANRLTSKQMLLVRYNTAMLYLHTGNLNRCQRMVEQITRDYPNHELTHSLRLVLAVKESKKKKLSEDKTVYHYLSSYQQSMSAQRSSHSSTVQLVSAQILFEHGDMEKAVEALSSPEVGDLVQAPCTVATLSAWYVQSGKVQAAVDLLSKAVVHQPTKLAKDILAWAVHYLATSRGLYRQAADLLNLVRTQVAALANDKEILAMLVLCLSNCDVPAARGYLEKLESSGGGVVRATVPSSSEGVEELERHAPSRASLEELGYRRATDVEETARTSRNRHRALRRPAKEMTGRPDPERWITMAARSYIMIMPERRKRELKRLRAIEQESKRIAAERAKALAA